MATRERGPSSESPPAPRPPPPVRRSPSAAADESPSALYKLEPIHQARASTVILGAPQRAPRLAGGIAGHGIASHAGPGAPRGRRPSQDEIRALLQRTTAALDRIVQIRESMEPFVDFAQFDKPPTGRRGRRPSSTASASAAARRSSGGSDADPLAAGGPRSSARTTPASSYGSTASSSSLASDDPLAGDADRDADPRDVDPHSSARSTASLPTLLHQSSSLADSDVPVNRSTTSTTRTLSKQEEDEDEDEEDEDEELGDVPPLKEARLERLKHIDVSFVEGLPREFYQALARFLFSVVEIKTRHSRFNFYKEAFTGADAVREMVLNGFCEDQAAALRLGSVLVRLQLVEHVSRVDDQLHNSKDNFYRFTKQVEAQVGAVADASLEFARDTVARSRRASSVAAYRESVLASRESAAVGELVEYDFSDASDEVHALVTDEALQVLARVLLKVFERKNKLLFYKGFVGCFLGAEAVNVLRELRLATSLIDAVLVGQALLDEGLIEPIASAAAGAFQDKYVFYRLTSAAAALADSTAGLPLPAPRHPQSSPSTSLSARSAASVSSSVSSSSVSSARVMTP